VSNAGAQASGAPVPAPPITLANLQADIQEVITAIQDPNGSVNLLFQVIKNRQK